MPIVPIKQIIMSIIHKKISFLTRIQKKCLKNENNYSKISYQDQYCQRVSSEKKHPERCENSVAQGDNIKMDKEKNISIINAANYMIQLYYQCGETYNCTRIKLEKLLSIGQIIAWLQGTELFQDSIVLKSCGVGIPSLPNWYAGTIIDPDFGTNNTPIRKELLKQNNRTLPLFDITESDLSDYSKRIITNVFLRFGNYDARTIGTMFDDFKNSLIDNSTSDSMEKIIDRLTTISFFHVLMNRKSTEESNEVLDFICKEGALSE